MINQAYHQFLLDENRSLRQVLLKQLKERQHIDSELQDIRDQLRWHEQQEALAFRGIGALAHQSKHMNAN
jgi:hypothetical protein